VFVPNAEVRNCTVIASKTGKPIDIDEEKGVHSSRFLLDNVHICSGLLKPAEYNSYPCIRARV
jgi:hypothetical protein